MEAKEVGGNRESTGDRVEVQCSSRLVQKRSTALDKARKGSVGAIICIIYYQT
jgi:hypothetical protein